MSLPDLIEIVPLDRPVRAEITVPGSKSITNRALILAALADGEVTLEGALWSEDTQVMTEALEKLGFEIKVEPDPNEFCNRRITVRGLGGKIPNAGTAEKPLEIFVGNAGTAARFLAAMVCLGNGVYRLSGVPRMHERPQAALIKALRELGYEVESENGNDKLPVEIVGIDPMSSVRPRFDSSTRQTVGAGARSCSVSIEKSSQFASALLLCAKHGGWNVLVVGENAEESPYVAMTLDLVTVFPWKGGAFQIELDASSGGYFLTAERFVRSEPIAGAFEQPATVPFQPKASILVANWPTTGWQIDQHFLEVVRRNLGLYLGLALHRSGKHSAESLRAEALRICGQLQLPPEAVISRKHDLGDSIMMAIVLGPFGIVPLHFKDLGRLRLQECERVVALRTELTKCGAKVIEEGDTLTVYPSQLHGAEIETYNDHRMAMCFAILGLKVPGIKLKNPACVKKTFPNFFQKLAAPPPNGLGAEIRDGKTGRKLGMDELFAE